MVHVWNTSTRATNTKHEALYQELAAVLKKHEATLTPRDILAVVANMVGKLIALQDQRTTTSAMAIHIVSSNIEAGNKQALDELHNTVGTG